MADIQKMLSRAEQFIESVDELFGRVEVKNSGEHRVAMMLMLTISEQCSVVLQIFRCGSSSHAPIVLRSMLEALMSLSLLLKDPKYADQMRFKDASENVRLCDDYIKDLDTQQDKEMVESLTKLKAEAEKDLKELQAKGFKKKQIADEFELAGIKDNYLAYRVYCGATHNQLAALMARHAGKPLRYRQESPESSTVAILSCMMSMLVRAVHTLPAYTTTKDVEVTDLVNKIDEDWKAFQAG